MMIRTIRRFLARPEDLAQRTDMSEDVTLRSGVDPLAVLAPFADLISFLTAVWFETSADRAQMLGFAFAAVICLGSLMRARLLRALNWTIGRYAVVMVVILLAFFLRNGLFGLLTNVFGLPGQAAVGFAVITTAALMRAGLVYCAGGSSLRLGDGRNWRSGALALMLLAYFLRLIYCSQIDLLPTEAYYWNYSRHLDFGYLDHPPMVALLIRAGTTAFGNTEFGVRIGALCSNLIAALFMFRLARNLFGEASAWVAVVLMQTLPYFFLSGMEMNPDAPLIAAWTASLYYMERALIAQRARAWWGVGLCLGLGLFSKYTIALLGASVALFMALDSRSRMWWRRPQPYGATLLAAAIFFPVILWNAEHDWASFAFQGSRRLAEKHTFGLPLLLGSAFLLLSPTGAIAAIILLRRHAPSHLVEESADRQRAWRFQQISLGVPLAVFTVFSLFHDIEVDWLGPAWIAALPFMAYCIVHARDIWPRGLFARLRGAWLPTLLALLIFDGLRFQYFAAGIPGLGYGDHPETIPVGWRELGRQVNSIAQHAASRPLIVGMDRYFLAGELAFYAPDPNVAVSDVTSAHLFGHVGLMYERWTSPTAERGRTLLLISWDADDLDSPEVRAGVEELGSLQEGELRRDERFVRSYYYRFAFGYLGFPPKSLELPHSP
jgi:dolichol-phosphate mannosyltransferase